MNLLENPFHVLGASPRDDRRRIVELAEERSLSLDPAVCAQARADLTHPRNRLAAEVAWLPGLAPDSAGQAVDFVQRAPGAIRSAQGLPTLAKANLLAAALPRLRGAQTDGELHASILELAALLETCEAEQVRALINEERALSGFPEVRETSAVAEALAERRKHYRTAIKDALEELPPRELVAVVTRVVTQATGRGARNSPALIDDMVNTYEVEAQRFLDAEARTVERLVETLRRGLEQKRPLPLLRGLLSLIEKVVTNWDLVAQPIQLSALSRGVDHDLSHRVAGPLRALAVDLFNEHGLIDESKFLTSLLQNVFQEVPRVAEVTKTDAQTLQEIAQKREDSRQEWARAISFEMLVGKPSPQLLKMSTLGIEWDGVRWPLESITRVRWGGISNPALNQLEFTILFGNGPSYDHVITYSREVYSLFTEKLWRAVGGRLLTEMVTDMRDGRRFMFGHATIHDHGVEFAAGSVDGSSMRISATWKEIQVESANGCLVLKHSRHPSASVEMPYLKVDNAHVLEIAIRNLLELKGQNSLQMSHLLRR
jgi:hypothetical protein